MIYRFGKRYYYAWLYGARISWWQALLIKYYSRRHGFYFRRWAKGWKASFCRDRGSYQ